MGIINSRYKDLYDLYALLVSTGVLEENIIEASVNTFLHRGTSLPEHPEGLSAQRWESTDFDSDWRMYLKRIDTDSPDLSLLREKLLPRLVKIYSAVRSLILER